MDTGERSPSGKSGDRPEVEPVELRIGQIVLAGDFTLPPAARGAVLFAHGSGSSRLSPRNRFVARQLQEIGLGTCLLDLLSPEEEMVDMRTRHLRFDIRLLADRLIAAAEWIHARPAARHLKIGLFGASTGAAAALVAAAERPEAVGAVVSRGGRPDLAGLALGRVRAPTLLIVGGDDELVIELNQEALRHLRCPARLEIIPGATHLFEEAGALEQVADLAGDWFLGHLGPVH